MNTPLLIWGCIVALFAGIILVKFFRAIIFCSKGKHRFLSFGSEKEEFFIPGDPSPDDFEEFDDL